MKVSVGSQYLPILNILIIKFVLVVENFVTINQWI